MRRSRRVVLWLGLFGAATPAILASCTIFDGAVARAPDGGASADAAEEAQSGDPACHPKKPPPRPADLPDEGSDQLFVVGRTLHFSDASVGYDLDDSCTCTPGADAAPRCVVPLGTEKDRRCDADGGIDNVVAKLVSLYPQLKLERGANDGIAEGSSSVIVRLDRWNGTPNDKTVRVSVFRSQGPIKDGAGGFARVKPTFTLDDEWSIERTSVKPGPETELEPIEYGEGHVVDNILVVRMITDLTIDPSLQLRVKSGVITARIVPNGGGGWTLSEVIAAGRWLANDLVASIGNLEVTLADGGMERLCNLGDAGESFAFNLAKGAICAAVDVVESRDNDGHGLDCNALSAAVAIDVAPARPGRRVDAGVLPSCSDTPRCPK